MRNKTKDSFLDPRTEGDLELMWSDNMGFISMIGTISTFGPLKIKINRVNTMTMN